MVSEPVPESALMMLVIWWNVRGEGEENHSAYLHREPSYKQ